MENNSLNQNAEQVEPIVIETKFDKENFFRVSYLRWKIEWLRAKKGISILVIAALIILALGIIAAFNHEGMNPFILLGGFLCFLSLAFFMYFFDKKRRFKVALMLIAEKNIEIENVFTYSFSELMVSYRDKVCASELTWGLFSHYSIYENFLLIFIDEEVSSALICEKTKDDAEVYEKILALVDSKLHCKDIKFRGRLNK